MVIKHIIKANDSVVLPTVQTYKTVCLFADVSGFTKLSEDLCTSNASRVGNGLGSALLLNPFASVFIEEEEERPPFDTSFPNYVNALTFLSGNMGPEGIEELAR